MAITTTTTEPLEGLKLTLDNIETPSMETNVSAPIFTETRLTLEEQKMVDDFSKKIDLTNSTLVLQYGSGAQKKLADFSASTLNTVQTKDLGEVGELLTGVVGELKEFNKEEEKKGLLGFFKKNVNKLQMLRTKYETTEKSIGQVVTVLNTHQVQLLKDISNLDRMYEINLAYFKELSMYIMAGKQKLEEVRNGELAELKAKAEASGLMEDAQAAKDLAEICERFEKKLYDIELTRTIAMQTAPQIRLIQNNDTIMAEKIQSTIVNTIPLWKSQMTISLGIEHSLQASKTQRAVDDLTNELLKKNAEKLKMATIETAKEAERGIVDIETLKHTNETLISTFDEVLQIQEEGRQKRKEAEAEIQRLEDELKTKLLQVV